MLYGQHYLLKLYYRIFVEYFVIIYVLLVYSSIALLEENRRRQTSHDYHPEVTEGLADIADIFHQVNFFGNEIELDAQDQQG